jgi:hypothetical protein
MSSPVRINLRLLIVVVEGETLPSKRRCADDDQQSNDKPLPAHQCFRLDSLAGAVTGSYDRRST